MHDEWFENYRDLYRPHTKQIISEGKQVNFADFADIFVQQAMLRRELEEIKIENKIDLWVNPSTTTAAPEGLHSTGDPVMNLPWSFIGLPTITIPAGTSPKNLPLGLQFTGSFLEDERLLGWVSGMISDEKIVHI